MKNILDLLVDGLADNRFAVVDNFISPQLILELRESLSEHYVHGDFHKAGVGNNAGQQIRENVRGDEILWLYQFKELPCVQQYLERMDELIRYFNQTLYLGLKEAEVHFAVYPIGTFYKRHLDRFKSDSSRTLSIITYLNDDWKDSEGGQLVVYKKSDSGEEKILINPEGGRLVCFDSALIEHEVLPSTRERMSITGWMLNSF